jgi:hypothetical protein
MEQANPILMVSSNFSINYTMNWDDILMRINRLFQNMFYQNLIIMEENFNSNFANKNWHNPGLT